MTQDIVFDDLETPCWRQRDTEMDTDILEKRAAQPMMILSPTSLPNDSTLKNKGNEGETSPDHQFGFGARLGTLGDKPIREILDE